MKNFDGMLTCLYDLNRAQLFSTWNKSRLNKYSDYRKQIFHEKLGELFSNVIISLDFSRSADLPFYRQVMDFFSSSINLLDNNTINVVPHEMIKCLNVALKDWVDDYGKYIFVTTDGQYCIHLLNNSIDITYQNIRNLYGIDFPYKLVNVEIPKYLLRDYLTNVVLYHELGHFVDNNYKLTETILPKILIQSKDDLIHSYFPYIDPAKDIHLYEKYIENHLCEYFADLFASQYAGTHFYNFLLYLEHDNPNWYDTHPNHSYRKKIVEDFLNGVSNPVLDIIKKTVKDVTKKELKVRFTNLPTDDFYNLVPTIISNEQELHSLFKLGWDVYLSGGDNFKNANAMSYTPSQSEVYNIVNNLIEKSINNFLIVDSWNKH